MAAFWLSSATSVSITPIAGYRDDPLRELGLFALEYAEPVDSVKRRHFVAFGQGRIIEYRFDEVVDPAAEGQHRLTDVDQLGCALADDVDAEQLAGLTVKYQLQEPDDVAQDLTAGDLLVAGLADLVRDRRFGQLLFVLAD